MTDPVSRIILWNIPELYVWILYIASACCMVYGGIWYMRRRALYNIAQKTKSKSNWQKKIQNLVDYLGQQKKIREDPYAGLMHLLSFWGFIVLLIATTLVGIEHHFDMKFLVGWVYIIFSLGADLGGLAFCIGIGMALWRRHKGPSRLKKDWSTLAVLWLMMAVGITGFFLEGLRISVAFQSFEMCSPVGFLIAFLIRLSGEHIALFAQAHRFMWAFHAILVVAFFVAIPVSIMRHMILAPVQVMQEKGKLGTLFYPGKPLVEALQFQDLEWKDLEQTDACLTCGRCNDVCPAALAQKPLFPREIILGIRQNLNAHKPPGFGILDDALWSCTTCHACDEVCPVHIGISKKIVYLRQGLVAEGNVPKTAVLALESTAQHFNPFGRSNVSRIEWTSGLNVAIVTEDEIVDTLYWVGCAGAFDAEAQKVSRAMISIFQHLQTPVKIMGQKERCTGDPARRMGEEGLFQSLARTNIDNLKHHQVKTVITNCAHCFHTLSNEYPTLGPMPRVIHHSQWLKEQLEQGHLRLNALEAESITYHDPCYLARANEETTAPRLVIDAMNKNGITEMKKCGKKTACCGGGGGQLWLDVKGLERVETRRAKDVASTKAQVLATACPYCKVMLEAGKGNLSTENHWEVKDIAQLVAEQIEGRVV